MTRIMAPLARRPHASSPSLRYPGGIQSESANSGALARSRVHSPKVERGHPSAVAPPPQAALARTSTPAHPRSSLETAPRLKLLPSLLLLLLLLLLLAVLTTPATPT